MALNNFFCTAAKLPCHYFRGYQNRETVLRKEETYKRMTIDLCEPKVKIQKSKMAEDCRLLVREDRLAQMMQSKI